MEWLKDILLNLSRPWLENDPSNEGNKHGSATEAVEDDDEIIAVITAAVAACINRTTNQVVVRSIRRLPSTVPVWNKVGRQEQTALRL